jgi:hypothetical protein
MTLLNSHATYHSQFSHPYEPQAHPHPSSQWYNGHGGNQRGERQGRDSILKLIQLESVLWLANSCIWNSEG